VRAASRLVSTLKLYEMTGTPAVYGTFTVTSPGVVNWITPPQMHINLEASSSVRELPSSTVGAPGIQGASVFGMQGMGVSAPIAAAVADATEGFARDVHIPNGLMLTMDTWSMMFASDT
jgi:hypothetical protein